MLENTEGTIKNGQSKETANWVHQAKKKKTKKNISDFLH